MRMIKQGFYLTLLLSLQQTALQAQTNSYDVDTMSLAAVQVRVAYGTGSGTLMIVDGVPTVFTNRHVVEGFDEATIAVLTDVNAPAEPQFMATLTGFSDTYDFAVYTITRDLDGNTVTASQLRDGSLGIRVPDVQLQDINDKDSDVRRGDTVGIFGYPGIGDDELVYTTGIISSVQYGEYEGQRLPMWYRTTAEMSPGNSGGMALNGRGEFIGIPTSVRTENQTGGRLGSLLAVPFVMAILNDDDGLMTAWSDSSSGIGEELDYSRAPVFGSVTLAPEELSEQADPHSVEMTSGGSINVSYLGNSCMGYASASPDYRLNLSADVSSLALMFFADDEFSDTTLIISGPDGSWHCNDDSNSDTLDPGLNLPDAEAGQYDIWVGSYDSEEYISGTLFISDEMLLDGDWRDSVTFENEELDWMLDPYFGEADLRAGFTPDPHTVEISAGGWVDLGASNYGTGCVGYVSSAPDYRLQWSGDSSRLQIFFVADNTGDDATLIINTPGAEWLCNDDATGTLNPGITLDSPRTGQYDIWVGSYSDGEYVDGELRITELTTSVP